MNHFFENWFHSLDKGLEKLSPQECRCLFSECAAQCGKDALKYLYQNLFEDCNGNLDVFFSRLKEIKGVNGRVFESGCSYEILFESCNCDLHTEANMNSARLCECSRQSLLWVMEQLVPDRSLSIEKIETILGGAKQCRFSIRLQ